MFRECDGDRCTPFEHRLGCQLYDHEAPERKDAPARSCNDPEHNAERARLRYLTTDELPPLPEFVDVGTPAGYAALIEAAKGKDRP
jgi:hypothetical protein